jgi:phosphate transport system substrate-binding protein
MNYGYCTNLPDACENAKNKEPLPISGHDSVCPKCTSRLMPIKGRSTIGGSERSDLIKVVGVVALVALLGFGIWKFLNDTEPDGTGSGKNESPSAAATDRPDGSTDNRPQESTGNSTVILRLTGSNTIGEKLAPRLVMAWLESIGGSEIVLKNRCGDGTLLLPERDDQRRIAKRCGDDNYHPERIVEAVLEDQRIIVDIRAHGTNSALKDLVKSEDPADIGMFSRAINPTEADLLKSLGDMTSPDSEHVIALDGIAVIVNRSRSSDPVSISIQELRKIFTGETKTWPGSAAPIEAHARDKSSGTHDSFKSFVLKSGSIVVPEDNFHESSGELVDKVAASENAIGFVGLGHVTDDVRVVPVSASAQTAALAPSEFTVKKEDYALGRRLHFYTAAKPSNDHVRKFVAFTKSNAGQAVVKASGFIDLIPLISPEPTGTDAACALSTQWSGGSDDYCESTLGKRLTSVSFRFKPNSDRLDNRALEDRRRLRELLERDSAKPGRIKLIGFADSEGDYDKNVELSRRRAFEVKRALTEFGELSRLGISDSDISVQGFGEELPVGNNDSDTGRQQNRRVEVWVY